MYSLKSRILCFVCFNKAVFFINLPKTPTQTVPRGSTPSYDPPLSCLCPDWPLQQILFQVLSLTPPPFPGSSNHTPSPVYSPANRKRRLRHKLFKSRWSDFGRKRNGKKINFCRFYGLGICLATSNERGATSPLIGHKSEHDFSGSQRKVAFSN